MPLASLFPTLPWPLWDIVFNVIAALGAILMIYGVFLESERRQDAVFAVGAMGLLVYAIWIGNTIFMIAMGGVALASLVEIYEIMTGRHQHSAELVESYRHPKE